MNMKIFGILALMALFFSATAMAATFTPRTVCDDANQKTFTVTGMGAGTYVVSTTFSSSRQWFDWPFKMSHSFNIKVDECNNDGATNCTHQFSTVGGCDAHGPAGTYSNLPFKTIGTVTCKGGDTCTKQITYNVPANRRIVGIVLYSANTVKTATFSSTTGYPSEESGAIVTEEDPTRSTDVETFAAIAAVALVLAIVSIAYAVNMKRTTKRKR